MRKLLFILITAFLSCPEAAAQTFLLDSPELYIGTSHGATVSKLYFSPNVKQDVLSGYNGGALVRYVTEKGRALQAELNFSQRGWTEKGGLYSRQLNYLEIPFLMHLYWGNTFRIFLNVGPKAGYLISQKVLTDKIADAEKKDQHKEIDKFFDYGATAGFGLQFSVKKQCFQLETRVNYSLSTLFEGKNYYDFSNNMNLAVNLGWLMRIK